MKPIIFCKPPKEIEDIAVPVNIVLSKEFQKQASPMMRTMRLETNPQKAIDSLDDNISIGRD